LPAIVDSGRAGVWEALGEKKWEISNLKQMGRKNTEKGKRRRPPQTSSFLIFELEFPICLRFEISDFNALPLP
jgi:hypothetical protein